MFAKNSTKIWKKSGKNVQSPYLLISFLISSISTTNTYTNTMEFLIIRGLSATYVSKQTANN